MHREWFQPASFPHYDVSLTRRARAVKLGAVEVDRRELAQIMRTLRKGEFMAGVEIGSGCIALQSDDKVRKEIEGVRIKFTADSEIDLQADFVVSVPFHQPNGRISMINMANDTHRLSATVTSGGDVHSVTYSLYQL